MKFAPLSRRLAAVFAVGALALTGCGSNATATATSAAPVEDASPIALTVFPSLNAIGGRVAEKGGFFDAEGVKVELTSGSNAAATIPQMIGGTVDIALMDLVTPIVARSKGVPLVFVAPAGVTTKPDAALNRGFGNVFVSADSDIKSIKDLEGKSVGLPQINSQPWVDTKAAVDAVGGDSSKVEFIEVPNTLAALEQGQVDAIMVPEPSGVKAQANPKFKLIGPVATPDRFGGLDYAFVTTEKYLKENPEKVKKFAAAILKANENSNTDAAARQKIAEGYIEVDPATLAKAIFPTMSTKPVTANDVEVTVERMAKYGLVDAGLAKTLPGEMLKK